MASKKWSLNLTDAKKSMIIGLLTAIISGVITIVTAGNIPEWLLPYAPIVISVLSAVSGYLTKNYLQNSNGSITEAETK